jgi:hypothetical protein
LNAFLQGKSFQLSLDCSRDVSDRGAVKRLPNAIDPREIHNIDLLKKRIPESGARRKTVRHKT